MTDHKDCYQCDVCMTATNTLKAELEAQMEARASEHRINDALAERCVQAEARIKELEAALRDYCIGPGCDKCEQDTHDPKA